jgi:hypothetical protein
VLQINSCALLADETAQFIAVGFGGLGKVHKNWGLKKIGLANVVANSGQI